MRSVAWVLWLLGLVACSTAAQDGLGRPSLTPAPAFAIGAMRTRQYTVTWLTGGTLRVENAAGGVVAEGVTIEDLETIDPFLRAACSHGTAAAYIDASLERSDPVGASPYVR
jgi:hypothetical protein